MKYLFSFIVLLSSVLCIAQNSSAKLAGYWHATCVVEQAINDGVSFCKICPIAMNTNNEEIKVASVIFNFNNKKLTIISPTDKTTTDIQYTSQTNLLTFALQEIRYDFTLLVVEDAKKIILKNQDGQLIYLERKDFEPTN